MGSDRIAASWRSLANHRRSRPAAGVSHWSAPAPCGIIVQAMNADGDGSDSSDGLRTAVRNFYWPRKVYLVSQAPAEDVLADIRSSIDRTIPPLAVSIGSKPLIGWVRDNRFGIRSRGSLLVRNSFRRTFVGEVVDRNGQTWVIGRFKMARWVSVFLATWFALLFLFMSDVSSALLSHDPNCQGTLCGTPAVLLVPLGMMVAGVALISVGIVMSQGGERKVMRFLLQDLQLHRAYPQYRHADPPGT